MTKQTGKRAFKTICISMVLSCCVLIFSSSSAQAATTIESKTVSVAYIEPPVLDIPLNYAESIKPIRQPITRDFNVFEPSGYTYEELVHAVSDFGYETMIPYVDTILKAEDMYGVNALYLMCKLGLESGWASHTSGVNNIGGWTTYSGSYMDFNSVDECILHIAEKLSTSYKNAVGERLEDVCHRYSSSERYTDKLMQIMIDRENRINNGI